MAYWGDSYEFSLCTAINKNVNATGKGSLPRRWISLHKVRVKNSSLLLPLVFSFGIVVYTVL